ncbi:hypothetical protein GCM10010441_35440 [Kitasatospora paracochleata]|uniref:Uncharacterized protein n=1 Tax=Kitasatospora paracochleata TaxID=58354 RepID=A0ABT1J3P8_9ACTN|nr:hypothetical protein [Kitasatospora paracochleata]MCP2312054.1 hypothetical protein [Kitasatospora paracochleata]
MKYRYWCGECGFKTPWGGDLEVRPVQLEHYRRRHDGIAPGGHREAGRRWSGGRRACLAAVYAVLVVLVVLVALVAARRHPF